jgi:hypothetical protein
MPVGKYEKHRWAGGKVKKEALSIAVVLICLSVRGLQPWMFETLMRELVTKKPLTYKTLTREVF